MFTCEEMAVLKEMGAGSLSDCRQALAENLAEADDWFTKEALAELANKVDRLTEREYRAVLKSGKRMSWRWWE